MFVLYCTDCHNKIADYGIVAVVIYEHVCEFYFNKGRAIEMTGAEMKGMVCNNPIITFLEKKGFLVTTESGKDKYCIKPASAIKECCLGKYFCCCKEE